MDSCNGTFYSLRGIARRVGRNLWKRQHPILTLVGNLSYRSNDRLSRNVRHEFKRTCDRVQTARPLPATGDNLHVLAPSLSVHESSRRFLDVS
jgi:hypothetical protein